MESNLVEEFEARTGATAIEALNHLKAKKWDLNQAIQDYLKEGSSRPVLAKSDAFDENSFKKLTRGISRATDNAYLVSQARTDLGLENVNDHDQYLLEAPVHSFTLPDFSVHPDGFREFLERDLIEVSCLNSLEQAGRLNWWVDTKLCPRLWPLSTSGDGNCLLHAASLGMWGFHDRLLILRQALHDFLTHSPCREALYRRWRWQLTLLNAEAGLVYSEEEWAKEWEAIISMASSTPRNSGRRRSVVADKPENATYESLEEIHVLALAHVLRRTIVVIADTMLKDVNGENLAPILFGGIYIPLEVAPGKCHKNPLVLSYEAAHFSALVTMDNGSKNSHALIPLTDSNFKLLPIQFVVDPGKDFVWGRDELAAGVRERLRPTDKALHGLLRDYLEIVLLPLSSSPSSEEYEDFDTPGDEEDIEKRFIEAEIPYDGDDAVDSSSLFNNNKNRAARQLQTVVKSFGSIGKSVSKKMKKNLGTITKMAKSSEKRERSDGKIPDFIVCARLGGEERPEYQQQMVSNYLSTARTRYEREQMNKGRSGQANLEQERLQVQAKMEGPKQCISPGCPMYASVLTSYLCSACYEKQKQQELNNRINSPLLPRHTSSQSYGLGKSTFYVEPGNKSGVSRSEFSDDPTPLNLSRSTFYPDRFYPKDWSGSAAGRSNIGNLNDIPSKRHTLQEVGNAIDTLGTGKYTPTNRASVNDSWENDIGRKIHSYNLSREIPPPKSDGTIYCVKGSVIRPNNPGVKTSPQISTSTALSPQASPDLIEIENVVPNRNSAENRYTRVIPVNSPDIQPITRIIPVTMERAKNTCLNVTCTFYGNPDLENYCSKCYKGRKEALAAMRPGH